MDRKIDWDNNKEIDYLDFKNPDVEDVIKEERIEVDVEHSEKDCKKVFYANNLGMEEKNKEEMDFHIILDLDFHEDEKMV